VIVAAVPALRLTRRFGTSLREAKKKPWPPWRLIATTPHSKIAAIPRKQRRRHFL